MSWLDRPVAALDTETTGIDAETARVVTCCIGHSVAPGLWDPCEWLINPGVPIPAEATKVHGITDEMAATGANAAEALAVIRDWLASLAGAGTPIVGHNLAYDLTVLDREFRRHLNQPLPGGLLCLDTLVLFRRFDFTTGNRRLEDLAYRHGITFQAHDATADALASLRLLHILAGANDLLPAVPVAGLQPLQAKWHAAHQEAARARRVGLGQDPGDFNAGWPVRALVQPTTEGTPS